MNIDIWRNLIEFCPKVLILMSELDKYHNIISYSDYLNFPILKYKEGVLIWLRERKYTIKYFNRKISIDISSRNITLPPRPVRLRRGVPNNEYENFVLDLSPLAGIHTLSIQNGECVRDLSPLIGIITLTIYHALQIMNKHIEPLKGIHTLYLTQCACVSNLTPLKGIHTLKLIGCWTLTDLTPLAGIHTLYLGECWFLKDLSPLKGVHTLTLTNCQEVINLTPLIGIPNFNHNLGLDTDILVGTKISIVRREYFYNPKYDK